MANKNLKVCAIALLGAFALCACDDIEARPSVYEKDAVLNSSDVALDVFGNEWQDVYDSIHKGTFGKDTMDKLFYEYSISVLGRYNALTGTPKNGETTLKQAYADTTSSNTAGSVATKFLDEHKAYWTTNNGERDTSAEGKALEVARLRAKWNTIEERIAKAMYEKISSGSYSYRNKFSEKKFLQSLKWDMAAVAQNLDNVYDEQLLSPDVEEKDVFANFLHRENYQGNYAVGSDEKNSTIHYVEDEIIPEIYRALLVEQYVLDQSYNSLGRSFIRKVNIVEVNENSSYTRFAPELMNYFVNNIIAPSRESTWTIGNDKVTLDDFKKISNVVKGIVTEENGVGEILNSLATIGAIKEGKDSTTEDKYFYGTEYGDLMEQYEKLNDIDNSGAIATFTASGTYSSTTGLQIKKDEVTLKDHVTNGWFNKDGLSSFSAFSDILFNPSVATGLTLGADNDRYVKVEGEWTTSKARDNNNYVARINGSYFLKNSNYIQSTDDDNGDIIFNNGGKYYVVQVEYAVSSTMMNKNSDKGYFKTLSLEEAENIVNFVNEIVADNEATEKLAKEFYLEQMDVSFFDQIVYDYFKDLYGDLYED